MQLTVAIVEVAVYVVVVDVEVAQYTMNLNRMSLVKSSQTKPSNKYFSVREGINNNICFLGL